LAFTIFFSNFASNFNTLNQHTVNKVYGILLLCMMICVGCEWQLKPANTGEEIVQVTIDRYDRIESLYLTTGDRSALQQMNTNYPMQTRMLIEDMLRIGKVDDADINDKLLHFFQDSILQRLLHDVQLQYAEVDDISEGLSAAFNHLKKDLPAMDIPQVYTQIGSFDQSIVVGNNALGISLDKYLGADYSFYRENYTENQRLMMERSMIVPDCISFYLLSIYPLPHVEDSSQTERSQHMGKIQWVVNRVTGRQVFQNDFVEHVDRYMKQNPQASIDQLLREADRH